MFTILTGSFKYRSSFLIYVNFSEHMEQDLLRFWCEILPEISPEIFQLGSRFISPGNVYFYSFSSICLYLNIYESRLKYSLSLP